MSLTAIVKSAALRFAAAVIATVGALFCTPSQATASPIMDVIFNKYTTDSGGNPILYNGQPSIKLIYSIVNLGNGDADNMLEATITSSLPGYTNNNILGLEMQYDGMTYSQTPRFNATSLGFDGVLPTAANSDADPYYTKLVAYVPVDTVFVSGYATATAFGEGAGSRASFNQVSVEVPSAVPEPATCMLTFITLGAAFRRNKNRRVRTT